LNWPRIIALIRKEFLAIWRDKKSRWVLIGPPILQLFLFAYAATLDVKNVSIGILNRDNGEQGFRLTEAFYGSPIFTHITHLKAIEEIAPYIDNQQGVIVISIDEEFSRNLDQGKPAVVQVILDGRKSNTAQIVVGYVQTILSRFNSAVTKRAQIYQQPLELKPRYWFNPNQIYQWFTVPGLLGILILVESAILTALSLAREKELGTFDQLLVSPLTPTEILMGKAIPALIISMIEGLVILLAGIFYFHIPFTGSIFLLTISALVFSLSIIGIGLFLSALCSNQQQAILAVFALLSPSTLLSGYATPIDNMPEWMQTITYIVPLRYFLVIARGSFLKDLPISVILNNLWPMMLIAAFTLTAATLLFRRKIS
jgi:ABC-2 type transport system permease protein